MSENLVRDVHDAVAGSKDLAEASIRPPGTTPRELRAIQRDVLRKLEVGPRTSVLEIGCGVGVVGVPVAARAGSYVGLDFAPQAVEVLRARLAQAGLDKRARALCLDVLTANDADLRELGRFDRVLMYAVLHYARTNAEALRFLERTVALLGPGGRALIGNIPLEDLGVGRMPAAPASRSLLSGMVSSVRWVAEPPSPSPVALTRRWKMRRILELAMSRGGPRSVGFTPPRLPVGYTLGLTTAAVERWLAALGGELTHHWELPAPGVPLVRSRADLIVMCR